MGGSFLAGVTATLVAAPCTGPFMGTAMACAFTRSEAVSFGIFTALGPAASTEETLSDVVSGPGIITWRKFTPETLAALHTEGKPVFLDFTADWCITCKVNERVALSKPEVSAVFAEKDIVALKADWTNSDEMVTTAREGYGCNSIPLYVYYPAGSDDYKILPQVLTPGDGGARRAGVRGEERPGSE